MNVDETIDPIHAAGGKAVCVSAKPPDSRANRQRGNFGKSGTEFYTTWEDHVKTFRSDDFGDEFDTVINALRFDSVNGGLFQGRNSMRFFCKDCPESAFEGNCGREYGFRIDKGQHSFLIRCNPMQDGYNFYVFCYIKKYLDSHMEKSRAGIRFITPEYEELFRIPDGDQIQITRPDGKSCCGRADISMKLMLKSEVIICIISASLPR